MNTGLQWAWVQKSWLVITFGLVAILLGYSGGVLAGCAPVAPPVQLPSTPTPGEPPSPPAAGPPAHYTYRVIQTYPHDPTAFTQGLVFHQGFLYEGTGLVGESTLRKVELESGAVLQQLSLPAEQFGEGIVIDGERILQLTLSSGIGYVFELSSFRQLATFSYPGEGWGLTHDGTRLILSDGTSTLRFLDPESLAEVGQLPVTDRGQPVGGLNELEFVNSDIFANIWPTDRVARISLETGQVLGWIDLAGLLPAESRPPGVDVLNGIAYDSERGRLFVTGKRWPTLFEIELVLKEET